MTSRLPPTFWLSGKLWQGKCQIMWSLLNVFDPFNLFSSLAMAKKLCWTNWLSLFSRQRIKSRYIIWFFWMSSILSFTALCRVNHCRIALEKSFFCQSWSRKCRDPTASHLPGLSSAQQRLQPLSVTKENLIHLHWNTKYCSCQEEEIAWKCCTSFFLFCFNQYTLLSGRIFCVWNDWITIELDFTELPCSLPSFYPGQCFELFLASQWH